jgi:hypothetical protein
MRVEGVHLEVLPDVLEEPGYRVSGLDVVRTSGRVQVGDWLGQAVGLSVSRASLSVLT